MMIDAHQHFWRIARGDYFWLKPDMAEIHRDFEADDLKPKLERHGIAKTILVQAAATEAETVYMIEAAKGAGFVAGVVGWVDFEAGDSPERIAAFAREPLIKGFRPMMQDLPDAAWMLQEKLTPAFRALVANKLRFDALVKPHLLEGLIKLVRRHPGLPVVIDHGAKPKIATWQTGGTEFKKWRDEMAVLASLGCACKLSGLVSEAGPRWRAGDLAPYADALVEIFTPSRLMWGSDWPVSRLARGYNAWRDAVLHLLRGLSAVEQADVLGGTAARFYGVN